MRKNNYKKRTVYTIILVVIAILVVGFAILSSTLNIFGGLAVIGGNTFDIKWNNVVVNENSTGVASTEPAISNNDNGTSKQVDFAVTLNTPGKFYEFTVDAVNAGTIDAMISDYYYHILDVNGNPVDVDFLIFKVSYADDIQLSTGHLLRAGLSATYKVRVEFSNDISGNELPEGETVYRFEFGVTYVQADDTAFEPGSGSSLPEIPDAITHTSISSGTYYRLNGNTVSIGDLSEDMGDVFTNLNSIPDVGSINFALKHTIENNQVNRVGIAIQNGNSEVSLDWSSGCYQAGTISNTITSLFNSLDGGFCQNEGTYIYCDSNSDLSVEFSEDDSITVSNGVYGCYISEEGSSYCYGE